MQYVVITMIIIDNNNVTGLIGNDRFNEINEPKEDGKAVLLL